MVIVSPPPSPATCRSFIPRTGLPQPRSPTALRSPTPTLLTRRGASPSAQKKALVGELPPASADLGCQSDNEVWLVIGGTGMAGFGTLRALSARGENGGVVLAPTRGAAHKAWMDGVLPGITPIQADINNPDSLRQALEVYPPVTHVFYSAFVRTSFDGVCKTLENNVNMVALRQMQRSLAPAFTRGTSACCCGGTGVYDFWNSMAGCGDVEENRQLFKKVFQALTVTNLRYCCLVTGAKHYGMHLGPEIWPQYREPFREDMIEAPGDSAYLALEDSLQELANEVPDLATLVLRPTFILGPVPRASSSCMNLSLSLGAYALLCRELGLPLKFLGSPELWSAKHNFCHSDRIAQLALNGGASLPTARCRRQSLNASDRDAFRYEQLWPELARWAGCCSWDGPQGRNGISFGHALGDQTLDQLSQTWQIFASKHNLRETRLREVLNITFLEQCMSVGFSARLSSEKCKRMSWASPALDGGWSTLRRALDDLCGQGLLPVW